MTYLFQRNDLCLYYPLPYPPSHSRLFTQLSGWSLKRSLLNGGFAVPYEWDTSPGGDQRLLPFSCDGDLQPFVHPSLNGKFCPILSIHRFHGDLVFGGERFGERSFHDPFQKPERMQIVR